jgi:F0F1-type ATP synthase membrane subunit b/b'
MSPIEFILLGFVFLIFFWVVSRFFWKTAFKSFFEELEAYKIKNNTEKKEERRSKNEP